MVKDQVNKRSSEKVPLVDDKPVREAEVKKAVSF
jgi:hypothetical protein